MLVWEGRQHDCNDDSQVRSAPTDFSSAPTCLAASVYVSQCMFLYDHHWAACCTCFKFDYSRMTVPMPACGLQLHSTAITDTLPFYVKRHAICHLYAMSIFSARYQWVASNTSIHVKKTISITVLLQMQVSWLILCAETHQRPLSCGVQRGS